MSNRPEFITEEDIARWNDNLVNDAELPPVLFDDETVKEVMYAGLWLCEELIHLGCPGKYVVRIQHTAAAASFGREPWEIHQKFLQSYKLNEMEFEPDPNEINLN